MVFRLPSAESQEIRVSRTAVLQHRTASALGVPHWVACYIRSQREKCFPLASPLNEAQMAAMHRFFSPPTLKAARVVVSGGLCVDTPPFYRWLARVGFSNLLDVSNVAAITFCDVIVSREPVTDDLLFHELVHVEQYRQLGVQEFAKLYVRGFLLKGGYEGIPLEVNAYALDHRFSQRPSERFCVEDEVTQWIREGKY